MYKIAKTDVNAAYCSSEILDTKDVLHVVHGKLDLCFPEAIAAYETSHHRQNQLFLAQETPAKNQLSGVRGTGALLSASCLVVGL